MGVMLKDEIRLSTLRERLEDRPNNLHVTIQLGENPRLHGVLIDRVHNSATRTRHPTFLSLRQLFIVEEVNLFENPTAAFSLLAL